MQQEKYSYSVHAGSSTRPKYINIRPRNGREAERIPAFNTTLAKLRFLARWCCGQWLHGTDPPCEAQCGLSAAGKWNRESRHEAMKASRGISASYRHLPCIAQTPKSDALKSRTETTSNPFYSYIGYVILSSLPPRKEKEAHACNRRSGCQNCGPLLTPCRTTLRNF